MVNFVLEALEQEVTLGLLANVYSESIPTLTTDARAIFYVKQADIKAIFKYQTDSFDTINLPESDIKYYVHDDAFTALGLNPANTMLNVAEADGAIATADKTATLLADDKMMVAHDFLRHLAKNLFGTHLGVDIFNNEKELMQNIRSICGEGAEGNVMFDINALIKDVSVNSESSTMVGLAGEAGSKYMTNENDGSGNLCRVLFDQMIGAAPARFAAIQDEQVEQSLPFEVTDTLSFKLNIKPAADQKLLTRTETDADVPDRSYEIRLVVVADDDEVKVNTAVNANEL